MFAVSARLDVLIPLCIIPSHHSLLLNISKFILNKLFLDLKHLSIQITKQPHQCVYNNDNNYNYILYYTDRYWKYLHSSNCLIIYYPALQDLSDGLSTHDTHTCSQLLYCFRHYSGRFIKSKYMFIFLLSYNRLEELIWPLFISITI